MSEINKKNSVYKLVKQKYGLEIYDVLIQQCYDMISYEYRIDDYRMFHLMCNHMNIGVLLVDYLKSEAFEENALCNKISNKYIELYNQMIYIRNLFIKSSICKDAKKVLKVIELIKDIKEQERKFLLSILQKLEVEK